MNVRLLRHPLLLGMLLSAAVLVGTLPEGAATHAAGAAPLSPIQHVVVIYQENQTFDSILGAVCQQRVTPCDGSTQSVTSTDGTWIPNRVMPDIIPDIGHNVDAQRNAMSGAWNVIPGCTAAEGYGCITHAAPEQIPNITALADAYAVSDATFASGGVSSFTAHVQIAQGSTMGFYGNNPLPSSTGEPKGPGWGCPSKKDALWGDPDDLSWEPSCIPMKDGSGPYRRSRVPHSQSIMKQLEAAGLTWHIYIGAEGHPVASYMWNFCSYIAWCDLKRRGEISPLKAFRADARAGRLPNVSFLPGTPKWSHHNQASLAMGDNYIGSILGAVQSGPDWATTAVFLTYDDCGCFYDHVTPPAGAGLRNPMLIISPWVRPGSTDSRVASQPYSMLAFIENNFGLPPLTPQVAAAYDYADSFDFSHPRAAAPPRMVHTYVSPRTRALVARLAKTWEDDPT